MKENFCSPFRDRGPYTGTNRYHSRKRRSRRAARVFGVKDNNWSSGNDQLSRIFEAVGLSTSRDRTHFLVGSRYGRRPDPIPNPNCNANPEAFERNPYVTRARNARRAPFCRISMGFNRSYSRTISQPSASERALTPTL